MVINKELGKCSHSSGNGYYTIDTTNGLCTSCNWFGAKIGCACIDGMEHITENPKFN